MAFFGDEEKAAIDAEQEAARIQITGGEGEGEGEGEGQSEGQGNKNDSDIKPNLDQLLQSDDNIDKNAKRGMVYVYSYPSSEEVPTSLDDLFDWDKPENQLLIHVWLNQEIVVNFWQFGLMKIGTTKANGEEIDRIDFDVIMDFIKHYNCPRSLDFLFEGKQAVEISDENEGKYGDALKFIYKADDNAKTKKDGLKLNLEILRNAVTLKSNNHRRLMENLMDRSHQVSANFGKEYPHHNLLNPDKRLLKAYYKQNPMNPALLELERREQEYLARIHRERKEKEERELKEKEERELKEKQEKAKQKKKQQKRQQQKRQQKKAKGKKRSGKGNFAQKGRK